MFCYNCGKKIDVVKFCPYCGKNISDYEESTAARQIQTVRTAARI